MKNFLVISLFASLFVGCVPDDEGLFDNVIGVSGNAGANAGRHMTEKEGLESGILRFDPKTQSACCSYCVTSLLGESLRDDSCDWWLCCGPEPVSGELTKAIL